MYADAWDLFFLLAGVVAGQGSFAKIGGVFVEYLKHPTTTWSKQTSGSSGVTPKILNF
jgi:hypothetical protein